METIVESHIRQFNDPIERIGATYKDGQGTFIRLWAPNFKDVAIEWDGKAPVKLKSENGYHTGHFPEIGPGSRYWFHVDGDRRIADPASRYQPEDTLGPSEVVPFEFGWTDQDWKGVPYSEWVIYEIHPGTFSDTHNFDGIIADLPRLKDLGVTTIEIMPVSQFSGHANWGYDGVFPHAVQHSYGGPQKLKALVDACHKAGLAIILDCVYNHVGPEGNNMFACGPYVRDAHHTPWGPGLNFDGPYSDDVRRFFLQTAWQWLTEFHFDGLRLDAVQMIFDDSPLPFLQELSLLKRKAEKLRGLPLVVTGESDMNDPRLVAKPESYGMGLDGIWADDFHHCLHATLTGEKGGYYADYGGLEQLARIYRRGVAFEGDYSPFRKRRHGRSFENVDKKSLIVETQNHDQTGNRLLGERLITLVGLEKAKLAAACVLLSPFTPFLFMGEEFGSDQPFAYFISHHDMELVNAVRKGRAEEWKDFAWDQEAPDPAGEDTFMQCVLNEKNHSPGSERAQMQDYYKQLIGLSKRIRSYGEPEVTLDDKGQIITLAYHNPEGLLQVHLSFNDKEQALTSMLNNDGQGSKPWRGILRSNAADMDSFEVAQDMRIAPFSVVVLER